jgi:hypothetical protein
MKKAIQSFFYKLFHLKQYFKSRQYERLIQKGIINRENEKIKLLREASILIPKKTKKGVSLYIPMTYASRMKIKAIILANFGMKMKVLGMKITDDLKFI